MYNSSLERPPELSLPPSYLSIKKASLENLFNISYWLWRKNPSSIFPIMLSSAIDVLKESIIVISIIFILLELSLTDALTKIMEAIIKNDFSTLLSIIISIAPMLVFTIIVTMFVFLIVSIIASGFLNSAEYGSYLHLLYEGKLSIGDVLKEMGKKWFKMAFTVLIIEAIKIGPVLIALAFIFFDILNLSSISLDLLRNSLFIMEKIFLWLGIAIVALIFTLIFTVLTIYSYPAAANGSYGFAAFKKSIKTCINLPFDTIAYCFLRFLSLIIIGIVSLIASFLGVQFSSIVVIILSFLIVPIFHIFKTAIFLKTKIEDINLIPIGQSIFKDFFPYIIKTGFGMVKKGWYELIFFLKEKRNIFFHFSSILFFFLGMIFGKQISSSGIRQIIYALGYVPGKMNPLFENFYNLPFLALDISFHNWQVSLATALSGIIFIVPVLTTLIFNGFILGIVEDIIQNLTLFLVAILPHGIIELPAFIITGSAGLRLGFDFLKALEKGNLSSNVEFHKALKRTIYIIFGLLPAFIIAGIIEAFITPQIAHLYGWE